MMLVIYTTSLDSISADMLNGFFVNWHDQPDSATHLKLLKNSSNVVMALDDEAYQVVGFITAISDNVLSDYIPFLEVLPEYQGKGIGKELVSRMLKELENMYMVD